MFPHLPVSRGAFLPLVLLLFLPCSSASAAGPERVRKVLVLYAYEKDLPGNLIVDESIRSTFKANSNERIEVFSEYLELGRFGDDRYEQQLVEHYLHKYGRHKIELIVPVVAPALDFVLKHRARVFPGIPVVYCALYKKELAAREMGPDVIGIPAEVDMNATLDVALKLQPDTRRVVVVGGGSAEAAKLVEFARQNFREEEGKGKVEFAYLAGLPMRELLDDVAHLPEKTIVIYISILRDGEGNTFKARDALELLSQASNAPIYGFFDTYLGHGIVGGRLLSFEAEGKNAAKLGLRILAGEKPEDMTVVGESSNTHMYDGRQLRRWGIREGDLPPGSIVRYQEPTIWDLYKWYVLGATFLLGVETLFIAGLLRQRVRRKRLERSLDDRLRFEMLITNLTATLVHVMAREIDQAIRDGLQRVGEFLGADRCSLAQFSEDTKAFRLTHSWTAKGCAPVPSFLWADQCPWISGQVLSGKTVRLPNLADFPDEATLDRQNFERLGTQSLVVVPLSAGTSTLGALTLATVRTARVWVDEQVERFRLLGEVFASTLLRRRSEEGLRKSQEKLRTLAGQLLQAQELERRRLAREMHDDLTQRLAVLAIEIGKLEHEPGLNGLVAERLADTKDKLVKLSEDVHDLSRQLHPAILDDLGLIDALRSECFNFQQREAIDIEYRSEDVPPVIPKDIALCLYRIAQEALRNIAKHAQTKQAQVTLVGNGMEVLLTISDQGKGFDLDAMRTRPGLGLASMEERTRLIEGELSIRSEPGHGTTISLLVSLPRSGP
jgi:two-component system, NarL family, sensor kinase